MLLQKIRLKLPLKNIETELKEHLAKLKSEDKILEAQRLEQRTNYDIEILREMGYCKGN